MDKQIAEFTLNASFRAAAELIRTLDLAQLNCSPEDYDALRSRVATAIAEIGEIQNWAFNAHPDLKTLVDERIEKYGQFC
jgi:hypothetical protein